MKMNSIVFSLFLITGHASSNTMNASMDEALSKFLASTDSPLPGSSSANADQSKMSMTSAEMESAITDLMLGKTKFGATPMGGSVKVIQDVLAKDMMPKVKAAHSSDQRNLDRLINELKQCSSTKNGALKKSLPSRKIYGDMSKSHIKCRSAQAVLLASKNRCLAEQRALYNEKVLKCTFFATVSKNYGTQKANQEVMKKAGSEKTEQYIIRISGTVCGNHIHGTRGQKSAKGGWGGGLPNSMLDKYLRAKKGCEIAKLNYHTKVRECARKMHAFLVKKGKCNQYQGLMDSNSCKSAVMVKDACESYSTCYYSKRKAYRLFERKVISEETDRKAEWRGLKRMECLIKAFADGSVTNDEVEVCKKQKHSTALLNIKYPKIPALAKCLLLTLYPATGAYKKKEFKPLPTMAKGVASAPCSGMEAVSTTPRSGSPKTAKCARVSLNGYYKPGAIVKCTNGLDVQKSQQKNSCPRGTKIFSPPTRNDWKTFLASAGPLRAPNWIIDVTRPANGCGGCTRPMNSKNKNQKTWRTSDGSPWWLRSTVFSEPNGDYSANCFMDLWHGKPRNENAISFNDGNCKYHSKSYYCQPLNLRLKPSKGSPKTCRCSKIDLAGTYTAGVLVKCEQCTTVYRSSQKNSCPKGMKIFSPQSRQDWKTFLDSAGPLRSPHWIIDITRPQNGCGGCKKYAMKSTTPQQATWKTSDGSPWWLRSSVYNEPNGDYHGNCFLNLHANPASADTLHFNDKNCAYHSRSYFCQPRMNDKNYGGHHRRRRAPPVKAKPKRKAVPKPKVKAIQAPRGVQLNYDQMSLVKAGWKVWSDFPYSHHTTLKDVQPTQGQCVMWGSKRSSGYTKLSVAAFAKRKSIENKKRVWENGVYWYTDPKRGAGSVGFSANKKVSLNSADTEGSQGKYRLSWHLHARGRVGGYRSGMSTGLNGDRKWRKVVMYGPCKGVQGKLVKKAPAKAKR